MDPTKAQTQAVFAHLKNQKANKVRLNPVYSDGLRDRETH